MLDQALAAVDKYKHVAWKILKNDADAEDALQNARIRIWKNIGSFEERSKLQTWVYRIVVTSALMVRRDYREKNIVSLQTFLHNPLDRFDQSNRNGVLLADSADGPEIQAMLSEIREVLTEHVTALPEQRKRSMLHTLRGEECTGNTAERANRCRARATLRNSIGRQLKEALQITDRDRSHWQLRRAKTEDQQGTESESHGGVE